MRIGSPLPPSRPVLRDPIVSQRNPFEIFLLLIGLVLGVLSLRGVSVSASVDAQGGAVTLLWSLTVGVGSFVGLVGVLMPLRYLGTSLQLERFGMMLMAAGCLVYAWIVLRTEGGPAAWPAGTNTAFGLACVVRVVQITRRYNWYSHTRGTHPNYDLPFDLENPYSAEDPFNEGEPPE